MLLKWDWNSKAVLCPSNLENQQSPLLTCYDIIFTLDTASEDECSAPSPSRLHSDSSIPYEVGSPPAQTVESASAVLGTSTSPEHSVFTDDGYSQDFESVAAQSKQVRG